MPKKKETTDTPVVFEGLARLIHRDFLQEALERKRHQVTVIGIDGPTAAGKTVLADTLAEQIRAAGWTCWTYRLDWTLAPREARVRDLENLRGCRASFPLEGELHMRLNMAREFLEQVRLYNERTEVPGQAEPEMVQLENLYSRDEGRLTGSATCTLEPGLIVIVEGHYTLRTELDRLIDYNIVLLGNKEELLSRKIARVKGYRSEAEAEDYFWRVDLPSFRHHLLRFGMNADLVVDNTDYRNPRVEKIAYLGRWLAENYSSSVKTRREDGVQEGISLKELLDRVFTVSLLVDKDLKRAVEAALEAVLIWDGQVGNYVRLSLNDIEEDLLALAKASVVALNERFAERSCRFAILHTNALHNVYYRRFPFSIGLSVTGRRPGASVNILADVLQDHLRIQVAWAGGYHRFRIERELGAVATADGLAVFYEMLGFVTMARPASLPLQLWTPTVFTIPSFLHDMETEPIFTGLENVNMSASQALCNLADIGGVWIHRFAKFSELRFFLDIVEVIGASAVKAGNYLIVVWSTHEDLNRRFKMFCKEWGERISARACTIEDEAELDAIVDQEREEVEAFVKAHCQDFRVLDGYLQCPLMFSDEASWVRVVGQIARMLKSPYRLLRKRATQFILRHFPGLSLPVSVLWDDLPPGSPARISLEAYTFLSPSILAEVYLWLALRDDRSAVLGANIYDIRKTSVDCRAYLEAALEKNTPIVLQGSLNALGQKEEENGTVYHGYLKPEDGVKDLVVAAMAAARDMVLKGQIPPLFGIGLDHVDVLHDKPPGRARRFLQDALQTECVTHYTLDGSGLFNARGRSQEEIAGAFEKVVGFAVDLLGGDSQSYIYDREVCAGELNYVGQTAMIPTDDEMAIFAGIFRQKLRASGLGALNTRPTLFIGNLGTTHHSFDSGEIAVERARGWRDRIKKDNFVSAVLHGTTNTHPDVLARATMGCHKINVAGDFLNTIVRVLPVFLQRTLVDGNGEPKEKMAQIRADMDNMSVFSVQHLQESLHAHCRSILDTINSPQLSPLDVSYFRYKLYKFPEAHVDVIVDELLKCRHTYSFIRAEKPTDPTLGYEFSASMIEVPYDNHYGEMVRALWGEGIRHFHIDVGDNRLIPREIVGTEKAYYLREAFPDSVLHAHLMVENPHYSNGRSPSYLERYISVGCNAVAVHRRAFTRREDLFAAFDQIRELGARPCLVIETFETVDEFLWDLFRKAALDWVIVMGVPIGYGGQIFDITTLQRISALHQYALRDNRPLLLEVDGGLTRETLPLCREAGAQVFAGWSIVRADTVDGVCQKVRSVRKLLVPKGATR